MMWMDTGRRVHHPRVSLRQRECVPAPSLAGAGDDEAGHAGIARAFDDCLAIRIEAVVGEIGTDVDQFDGLWHVRVRHV